MEPYWPKNDVLLAGQQALAGRTPSKKLLGYLKKYQQDLLTTDAPDGLPDFATHRDRLVALMRQKYAEGQGYHQTVGGRVMNLPKFWELMLSMDFVSHEIELANNIGYDNREVFPGLRSTVEAPYAEFVITSDALKREVATPDEIATPTATPDIVPARPGGVLAKWVGRVFKNKREIVIEIVGDRNYTIARLEKGGAYDKFMDHVTDEENVNFDISIDDIKALKGTLQSVKSLTELVRYSGFVKPYKKSFFTTTKKDKVHFVSTALLDDEQVEAIRNRAKKVEAKKS